MEREPQAERLRTGPRPRRRRRAGALRDAAPDLLAPIDESAPVSGHVVGPASSGSIAESPEHDWSAAGGSSSRPSGRSGRRA